MAVAADRSPWFQGTVVDADRFNNATSGFKPDLTGYTAAGGVGTADQAKRGNSDAHQTDGQNVLYIDSHVEFEKRCFVGLENDNIYTKWTVANPPEKVKGLLPSPTQTTLTDKRDSFLINDYAGVGGGGR